MVKSTVKLSPSATNRRYRKASSVHLFTPIRKLLFKVKRNPVRILGKRRRGANGYEYEFSDPDPIVATPRSPSSLTFSPSPSRPVHEHPSPISPLRVALQNEDSDPLFSDTVVITTLDDIPFCCHEDLLTMQYPQLVDVVSQLNAKLPNAMQIQLDAHHRERDLRREIEYIVGLRETKVPDAPKVDKKLAWEKSRASLASALENAEVSDSEDETSFFITPPTSPLARRSRFSDAFPPISPMLTRLIEEEEEEDASPMEVDNRPVKRRRVSYDVDMDDEAEGPTTPTPLPRSRALRSQSQYVKRDSPMPKVLRRSYSHRQVDVKDLDTRFITLARPKYRISGGLDMDLDVGSQM